MYLQKSAESGVDPFVCISELEIIQGMSVFYAVDEVVLALRYFININIHSNNDTPVNEINIRLSTLKWEDLGRYLCFSMRQGGGHIPDRLSFMLACILLRSLKDNLDNVLSRKNVRFPRDRGSHLSNHANLRMRIILTNKIYNTELYFFYCYIHMQITLLGWPKEGTVVIKLQPESVYVRRKDEYFCNSA